MKTSLAHLPQDKQDDLRRIVDIVLACAREAGGEEASRDQGTKASSEKEGGGPPARSSLDASMPGCLGASAGVEMIVLYGSHARGDWTYDKYKEDWITYEYVSDYDILILERNS